MKKITADLKYYNANTRNASVGDCVKRGLSVAYSMDYDAVSAELNKIKRQLGLSAYNLDPVFTRFMKARGDSFTRVPESEQITADEFCKQHPSGVYVVLVGKSVSKYSTHLAAIVDGDLFDSWDSLGWYVKQYAKVSQGKSDVYEFDAEYICKSVAASVQEYVNNNLQSKMPDCMRLSVSGSVSKEDRYTYELVVYAKLGELPRYCKWRDNITLTHIITMKTNPRMSEEENISSLTKKTKQKVYDWAYNTKAEIIDSERMEQIPLNKYFSAYGPGRSSNTERIILKMPEWAIPHITHIRDNGEGYDWSERYEMEMEALPEDPRYDENRIVDFRADTIRELKNQVEMYKDDYARFNYDF